MRLSDILASGNGNGIRDTWNHTDAAEEFGPLPKGEYLARIISGELTESRTKSTPGFSVTFEVIEPSEYKGRRFWNTFYLTPAAMPGSKRDLCKLGITNPEQLERPLPCYFTCKCRLVVHTDDNGNESNKLKSFEVMGFEPPEADPFAPPPSSSDDAE